MYMEQLQREQETVANVREEPALAANIRDALEEELQLAYTHTHTHTHTHTPAPGACYCERGKLGTFL